MLACSDYDPTQEAAQLGQLLDVAPVGGVSVAFHAMATTASTVRARELAQGPRYLEPGLDAFFHMLHSGRPVVSDEEMLRPIRFLAAVADAL